jgi:hypothetical protein
MEFFALDVIFCGLKVLQDNNNLLYITSIPLTSIFKSQDPGHCGFYPSGFLTHMSE